MIETIQSFTVQMLAMVGIHPRWLAWATPISLLTLLGTFAVLPVLVARLPQDYFYREHRPLLPDTDHWLLRLSLLVLKNIIGAVLLVAGIAMLVLPGPGLITVLAATALLTLPGKYRFERWLVSRPTVRAAIALMRQRAGRPPLDLP